VFVHSSNACVSVNKPSTFLTTCKPHGTPQPSNNPNLLN
jgi:hypothetical protein